MTDTNDNEDDDYDNNPMPLVEEVAENMAIYSKGVLDDQSFMAQAEQLLRSFEAIEGRPAADYLEIEEWSRSHLNTVGPAKFLVLTPKKDE
jgi:hypothetical protein